MSSWVPVSRTQHAKSRWRPRTGYEHAADHQVLPIMIAELARLVPYYVLGFIKREDESYQAVALVGLGGPRNVYVNPDSLWLCDYVPAAIRGFPFSLQHDADGNSIFCIYDEYLADDKDFPHIFVDDGKLEPQAAKALEFLNQCEGNRRVTDKATTELAAADVIEPWPISIGRGEGKEPLKISGLHRINEEALNKLDAQPFADMRLSGALPLAYAQLLSMAQMSQLTSRAEYLAKASKQVSHDAGLSDLFSNEDTGSLNFDAFDAIGEK